jgi:hypothetical protein
MRSVSLFAAILICTLPLAAQGGPDDAANLQQELKLTRSQLQQAMEEIRALRQDMQELRSEVRARGAAPASASAAAPAEYAAQAAQYPTPSPAEPVTVEAADKDPSFLASKIAELHQVKVESGSRYQLKLSGLVLMNAYGNSGSSDVEDLPNLAFPSFGGAHGSVGATLRQSIINLDAHGPDIFGAATSGDISVDFFGGSPTTNYGVTAGLIRMRTANVHLAWKNTTLNIGQDTPFISPLNPTSYATLAEPAMSWSGNQWVWTPQVMVEHRVALRDDSNIVLQGGVLDPLTEEYPPFQGRVATAGEASRIPAIAGRIAYDRTRLRLPFSFGFAGYRAQQRHHEGRADSWSVNTDFRLPLTRFAELTGEWYSGQAVGGLGGGIWTSVGYASDFSQLVPMRSSGGWAQLKLMPAQRVEVNTAFGQDNNHSSSVHHFANEVSDYGFSPLQKNRTIFSNVVFKPNSVLLFALEYRHIFTAPASGAAAHMDHVNLSAGVRF